jgi:WD40 repeat protein
MLCVSGVWGIIKVIDTVQQCLIMTLSGHGDEIYDFEFSPFVCNLEKATCIALFAGHKGHHYPILTVSWHCSGNRFASGIMDTTVKQAMECGTGNGSVRGSASELLT